MKKEMLRPDYLFEISWEVCNKVGGIYTVVSTLLFLPRPVPCLRLRV